MQLLPWILAALSLALLLGAALLWALKGRPQPKETLPTQWTVAARPVFSSDERRVYRQLREALPHHVILSKLPLVRFCQPTDPTEVRYWFDLLGAVHVTFAICSANGRVLAAVDLETERGASRRALQIKQAVLSACKVRHLRCTADTLPSIPELQMLVPQTSPVPRGPQAASGISETRDHLASTLASRRRERTTLWADSGFLQDSFFGSDPRADSAFGGLRTANGLSVREVIMRPELRGDDLATAGVVIEPNTPVRH
jgi:hypothetical protein